MLRERRNYIACVGYSSASVRAWLRMRPPHRVKANPAISNRTIHRKANRSRGADDNGTADEASTRDHLPAKAPEITGVASSTKRGMWRTASKAAINVRKRGTSTRAFGRD